MRVTAIEGDRVRVSMPTAGGMENGHGTTHGGAIFALADQAFGIAGNLSGGEDQIGLSAYIQYLSVPAGATLEAVARKVSETEKTSLYAVEVYSGDRMVASFEGVGGFKIGVPAQKE